MRKRNPSRSIRLTAALILAGAASGCIHAGGYKTATIDRTVPVTQAFITPPPGGPAILSVVETRYANALTQKIVLENRTASPGENVLLVRAYGPLGKEAGRGRLDPDPLDTGTVNQELRARFPGIPMQVSGLYAQNRYGPFGYATGATGGVTCVYAFQRIAAEAGVFKLQRGAITWRLRLCDSKADARTLLFVAYNLTIVGYFDSPRWNPYGDPPPLDPRIGTPGATVLPQQTVDPTVVAAVGFAAPPTPTIRPPRRARPRTTTPPRPRSRTRAAARPVAVPARPTVLNQPLPGAAVVPRPDNTDLSEPDVETSNLPSLAPPLDGNGNGTNDADARTPTVPQALRPPAR